ncbi:carboxypeptidase regulatory-like domain-containing protein, partial [Candidatus Bathyarchaeota archaeon]|nr:carboxypeptidase regulatory-like domain-containing protein [Candidatus Bathyarchaeota archaeon]
AGSPVPDAIVRMVFQPLGQASLAGKTDSNGKTVFQEILSGEYSFAVEKTNYEASAVSSQVLEGETSELTVELEKSVSKEPSPPDVDGRPGSEGVPLFYGLIPSMLIFVILIGLYIMINGINKGR